jgi:hypothetical protein
MAPLPASTQACRAVVQPVDDTIVPALMNFMVGRIVISLTVPVLQLAYCSARASDVTSYYAG